MAAQALERGSKRLHAAPVPPMEYASEADHQEAAHRAERQRVERVQVESFSSQDVPNDLAPTLVHVMLPSDCTAAGTAFAGVILKQMDNTAGITAVRHCRSHVVTASLEAVDFHSPVFSGDIVSFYARPTFTSRRSMEIEVNVYAECLRTSVVRLANTARFTFVSLDKNRKPQDLPQLEPQTEVEKARFAAGLGRYQKNKETRASEKSSR
jgi:acyl-coenzyme A thioesterase 7